MWNSITSPPSIKTPLQPDRTEVCFRINRNHPNWPIVSTHNCQTNSTGEIPAPHYNPGAPILPRILVYKLLAILGDYENALLTRARLGQVAKCAPRRATRPQRVHALPTAALAPRHHNVPCDTPPSRPTRRISAFAKNIWPGRSFWRSDKTP